MSRASRRAVAVLAGTFVLLLILPSPAAAFFTASLDVVIVVDKPSYQAGEVVNATVYVIWGGTLSDAAFIDLEFTVNTYPSWIESIPLTRESAGVYRGSIPILANMTGLPWSNLRSDASVGSLSSSGYALVFLKRSPVLTDHAFLSAYEAAPGQTVNGTLQTYLDGALADVDNLSITASLSVLGYPYLGSALVVRNVSAGTYGFSYTVPNDLNLSGSVQFYASAEVSAILTTFGLSNLPTLRVDVADPFLIWTHQVALDSVHAAFDVWVADPSGTPLAGAGVWTVVVDGGPHFLSRVASATAQTDSAGRASFDFPFLSAWLPPYLSYYGYVTRGSANESFTGYLSASAVPAGGFVVQRDNPEDLYEPGEHAVLRYTAHFNGAPYAGSVILYTAYNDSSLLTFGRVTTDGTGSFAVNFTMPSDGATIELSTQAPDGTNTGASLFVLACRRMTVQVGALQVGTTGHLVAELPGGGGPWSLDIEFYPSNTSAPPDVNGGWQVQDELTGVGVRLGTQTVEGGTVHLSLPLPSYLPAGSYYLSIVAYPLNAVAPLAASFPLRYAYAALVIVQGPPVGAALLVLVTLPIVLAVGVAAWVVERRRRRQPPPRRTEPQPPPPSP